MGKNNYVSDKLSKIFKVFWIKCLLAWLLWISKPYSLQFFNIEWTENGLNGLSFFKASWNIFAYGFENTLLFYFNEIHFLEDL